MDYELAIKQLQEEIMYLHKDMANLHNIIENLQKPELHTHYIMDFRTCNECKECDQENLEDFI